MTNNEDGNFPVSPTAPEGTGNQHTDISLTNLFGAYIQLLSVERQLIWGRFSAMLVANTIIFYIINNIYNDPAERLFTLTACVFGVLLCFAWLTMTHRGWNYSNILRDVAERFKWEGYPNPLSREQLPAAYPRWDIIRYAAYSVIVLFIIAYVLILIRVSIRAFM
jgi:hypothetical protein